MCLVLLKRPSRFKHDFFLSYLAVQNFDTYIAKQCSPHVQFRYFVMGSHLGHCHISLVGYLKQGSIFKIQAY